VSRLGRGLAEQVEAFRRRPLEGDYPYLRLNAKQAKMRDGGHARSKALVIAYAVHETGRREVIGLTWARSSRSRSGSSCGATSAAAPCRPCASGSPTNTRASQRDREGARLALAALHRPLRRNIHQHCRPSQRGLASAALREIFNADGRAQARERLGEVSTRLPGPMPKVAELLEQPEEDLFAFYAFPAPHWSKLRRTNSLERVNREIGRPTDVVGILPDDASAIRLAGALLIEQNDEWVVGRRYLSAESLALVLVDENERASQREEVLALQPA
jgi:putative transposase